MRSWHEAMAGAAAGAVAWIWYAARPAQPVLVGRRRTQHRVPATYQASVFPTFGAVVARGIDEWLTLGDGRRLALVAASSTVAVLRLRGALPWSGHGFFLGAVLAYEARAPQPCPVIVAYALGGLAIMLRHKAQWNDLGGAVQALVLGGAMGAALGTRRRH